MISFNRKQTCSEIQWILREEQRKNEQRTSYRSSGCDIDKTLRPKTIQDKLKIYFIKNFLLKWERESERDQTSIPLHTLAMCAERAECCVCVYSIGNFYRLCDLMMPEHTIPRMNQSDFYLVFDCLKMELGQFCHVINRCNFLESNCITRTFGIQSMMRRHASNAHIYNTRHIDARLQQKQQFFFSLNKSIQTMMNWAYLIWSSRVCINYRQFRF